jgi:predicted HTH domain antitoxin
VSEIKLTLPAETLLALKGSSESAAAEVRLAAAVKLYELGRLSSGAAASLAGIPRTVFLTKLADYGVATFKLSKEELQGDLERA